MSNKVQKLIKVATSTLIAAALLAGCTHPLTLMSRDGGMNGTGEANEAGKKVLISVGAKVYEGSYIYDGGSVIVGNSYGTATAYSGTRSATAYGSSTTSTYVPGSGNGKILAVSPAGGSMRCDFQYTGGSGIGYCKDADGREYDLLIR